MSTFNFYKLSNVLSTKQNVSETNNSHFLPSFFLNGYINKNFDEYNFLLQNIYKFIKNLEDIKY